MTPETTAQSLLSQPTAALAWQGDTRPMISRIGVVMLDGALCTLVSDLSPHTDAMRAHPGVSLLVGDHAQKGDPLNHPRLSLEATARFVDKIAARDRYLAARPKTKLYYDFADFHLVQFDVQAVFLNGGFGKAHHLDWETII